MCYSTLSASGKKVGWDILVSKDRTCPSAIQYSWSMTSVAYFFILNIAFSFWFAWVVLFFNTRVTKAEVQTKGIISEQNYYT